MKFGNSLAAVTSYRPPWALSLFLIHNLGYPRVGALRQLKQSLEAYWRGKGTVEELQKTAAEQVFRRATERVRIHRKRMGTKLRIALAIRDEVRDLETAGISVIQVDEPALREGLALRKADWAVSALVS